MGTITVSIEKYENLVKKANAFDLITELAKSDTCFMSDMLSGVIKAQKTLCPEITIESKTVEVKEMF